MVASTGWLIFLVLALSGIGMVPLAAGLLRRGLPAPRRARVIVEPVVFGSSIHSRRSPRHAVLLHRSLSSAFFIALLALFLIPAVTAVSRLHTALLPSVLFFVLPTLVVLLHARRRRAESRGHAE